MSNLFCLWSIDAFARSLCRETSGRLVMHIQLRLRIILITRQEFSWKGLNGRYKVLAVYHVAVSQRTSLGIIQTLVYNVHKFINRNRLENKMPDFQTQSCVAIGNNGLSCIHRRNRMRLSRYKPEIAWKRGLRALAG